MHKRIASSLGDDQKELQVMTSELKFKRWIRSEQGEHCCPEQ